MKRFNQLDALRGFFLIIMAIDHFEGPMRKLLYEKIGYFTAAEGFVFLSGIVAGIVYGRVASKQEVILRSFKRAAIIYRYQLITVVLLFCVIYFSGFYADFWYKNVSEYVDNSTFALLGSLMLLYEPNPIDILPLYFFLIMLMPLMLILLRQERVSLFWMITIGLWTLGYFVGNDTYFFRSNLAGIIPVDLGFFNFFSWQLLFFVGLYFGFLKQSNPEFKPVFHKSHLAIAVGIVVFCFIIKITTIAGVDFLGFRNNYDRISFFFNKSKLGIGRVINFLAFGYIVSYSLIRYPTYFKPAWMVWLGRNSIKVFTIHVISVIIFYPMVDKVSSYGSVAHVFFSFTMLVPLYMGLYLIDLFGQIKCKAIN